MTFKTIIEPFRIKSVEPIRLTTPAERATCLRAAHNNPFLLPSDKVLIDLLTDSGTSAMSSQQWAAMMVGDESYAGAKSWERFYGEIADLTGMPHVLPTHQGRAAERILYGHLGGKGKHFFSNSHFDTTRANIEHTGAIAIDLPCAEAKDLDAAAPFKGNLDVAALRARLAEVGPGNVAAVILTVTNNSGGGQPVSLGNAQEVAALCKANGVLFVLDCCRIAENAYFIKHREPACADLTYRDIAQAMFALADVAVMSIKKDGLVNMGGFLALRDDTLATACTNLLIMTEGFTTYGGLAGRDMEAIAVGLREVFEPDYLHYRIASTTYVGEKLRAMGVPVVYPIGGHAVYVDAGRMYPHIPPAQFPGQALVCALYLAGGVRAVELGSVMFGKRDAAGGFIPARQELVRLAIPRRVYTQSHMDYVVEVFEALAGSKASATGYRLTYEPPALRHFTAHFEAC
ncbi:MAG: tryptophanase [Myxococcales bacterium]|nr:tryptophanase [Myxococcales bacterium]